MVAPKMENLVYDIKLSSVVPARVTGENKSHDLTPMDLAMKLHYLKGLYFFKNPNNNNNINDNNSANFVSSIYQLKPSMFEWLVTYFKVCGRIRASPEPGGRPVIKLNDAGIRIVEARSSLTVDELLAMDGVLSLRDELVYGHPLGPDIGFCPLVFIQVTWFKCGGISIGLSWAHILGDIFSATSFMNKWSHYLHGHYQHAQIISDKKSPTPKLVPSQPIISKPQLLKEVNTVSDSWAVETNCKMGSYSFQLTSTQLAQLVSRVHGSNIDQCFEVISAILWKTIAKIRNDMGPKVVTICKPTREGMIIPCNGQVFGKIEADSLVTNMDLVELVSMIGKNFVDETNEVEELIEEKNGQGDFVVYGANLTFINVEETNVYDFEIQGQCPTFATYTIDGVGEEGVVLMLPGDKDGKNKHLVVILPEHELEGLKNELKYEWSIT